MREEGGMDQIRQALKNRSGEVAHLGDWGVG